MSTDEPISCPVTSWADEHPDSPRLDEETYGLDIVLRPARSNLGPTVALLGSYNLGGSYVELFGGRVSRAMRIVAIDVASGRIYHHHASVADAAPFLVAEPRRQASEEGDGGIQSVGGYFNVDLCAQLGLPPNAGTYLVFAWLNELTSTLRVARVSENPAREEFTAAQPPDKGVLCIRKTALSPGPGENGLALVAQPPRSHDAGGRYVYGAADPALLREAEATYGAVAERLVLLVMCANTRGCYTQSVSLPAGPLGVVHFDVDLGRLLSAHEPPQRVYAVTWFGGVCSPVLVLEPPTHASTR